MSMGEIADHGSTGRNAWRVIKKHFDTISTVTIVQAAVRIAVLLPLLLPRLSGGKLPMWISVACSAALYIAFVIPLRFWAKEKLRRLFFTRNASGHRKNPYQKWLQTGLVRYGRGILWGLPFLAGAGYFLYGKAQMSYTDMWQPVQYLAVLVGKEPNIGTGGAVAVVLLALFAVVFAYGWWRDLPVEYMPVRSLGTVRSLHWSKRIRKKHKKELCGNAVVNILLSVIPAAAAVAVLVPYVLSRVDFSLSMDMVANLLLRLLKAPLPRTQILELLAVLALLYLPLCVLRKVRNAALMGKLMHQHPEHHHHEEENGEGENAPERESKAHAIG